MMMMSRDGGKGEIRYNRGQPGGEAGYVGKIPLAKAWCLLPLVSFTSSSCLAFHQEEVQHHELSGAS